jgi:hypothetical protein
VAFTALDGPVVTFSEYSTNATFTGTDINNGGCAAGDRRRVTGINVAYIASQLNDTSTSSAQGTFSLAGEIAQREAQALRLALKSRDCHFRHAPRSGPIVPALKNAGHTDRRQ